MTATRIRESRSRCANGPGLTHARLTRVARDADSHLNRLLPLAVATHPRLWSPKKRLDLYYQTETRLQNQFASMPLYWQVVNYAIKPWMTGLPKNKQGYTVPNNNIFFRAYDTVFVSDDSPHDPLK